MTWVGSPSIHTVHKDQQIICFLSCKRALYEWDELFCFWQCKREGWLQKVKEEEGEGCNVYGSLEVNKVAGNFHFAPGKSFQQSNMHVHDFLAFQKESFNVSLLNLLYLQFISKSCILFWLTFIVLLDVDFLRTCTDISPQKQYLTKIT